MAQPTATLRITNYNWAGGMVLALCLVLLSGPGLLGWMWSAGHLRAPVGIEVFQAVILIGLCLIIAGFVPYALLREVVLWIDFHDAISVRRILSTTIYNWSDVASVEFLDHASRVPVITYLPFVTLPIGRHRLLKLKTKHEITVKISSQQEENLRQLLAAHSILSV